MTITNETIRVDMFSTIYNVLNSKVIDPDARNKQWIFTTVPPITAPNFVGFPILVINKAKIKKSFEVFDNSYSDKSTPVIITVYSTNSANLDSLSDSVDKIMTPSNFPQFTFYDYNENDGDADFGSGKVYFRTMTYSIELGDLE